MTLASGGRCEGGCAIWAVHLDVLVGGNPRV